MFCTYFKGPRSEHPFKRPRYRHLRGSGQQHPFSAHLKETITADFMLDFPCTKGLKYQSSYIISVLMKVLLQVHVTGKTSASLVFH